MAGRSSRMDYSAANAMLASGVPIPEIARRFGVTRNAIYQAKKKGRLGVAPPPVENHPPEFDDGGEHFPTAEDDLRAMQASMAKLIEVAERLDARVR